MGLKEQMGKSLIWNTINKVGYQLIALIVGIITARLLTPQDFGYIAALALFTILSNTLVESGFTAALVRRKENTKADYTAAFLFNITISVIFYIALYFCAGTIADYYHMPELKSLARIIFIAIIINAFAIIPNIILTHALKFKQIAIAELTSMVFSAVITIVLAIGGFGYWAIAAQQLSQVLVRAIVLWILSKWIPSRKCNFKVLKELFAFSALLIISSIISNVTRYLYNFIIGPRYSSEQLGYYGQAFKFHQIPFNVISQSITGVAYPVISHLNDEKIRQLAYESKSLNITAFITFPAMIGLWTIAPNFITFILTDKWMPMLPYFRLLILAGMAMPFITLHLNILNAINKPHLYFSLELVRNALMIILLFILNDTIIEMISGYLIANYVMWIVDSIIIHKVAKFTLLEQVKQLLPSFMLSLLMGAVMYLIGEECNLSAALEFMLQLVIGCGIYIGLAFLLHFKIIKDIKDFFIHKQ